MASVRLTLAGVSWHVQNRWARLVKSRSEAIDGEGRLAMLLARVDRELHGEFTRKTATVEFLAL